MTEQLSTLAQTVDDAHDDIPPLMSDLFRIIGYLKDERAFPTLKALSTPPHGEARAATADALGEIGGSKASEFLEAMLQDPEEDVRGNAVKGLFRSEPTVCYASLEKYVPPASDQYRPALALLVMQSLVYDVKASARGHAGEATDASRDRRWREVAKQLVEPAALY